MCERVEYLYDGVHGVASKQPFDVHIRCFADGNFKVVEQILNSFVNSRLYSSQTAWWKGGRYDAPQSLPLIIKYGAE